ncbi:hypothetical protein LVB77_14805 [Lysobacter sp. 5GHs7-4]|uniref:hypothetical protein n=1 Tax=Lysobacter sp. 5GHs7-4 TaxID=2904253 RepID=UPI001E3714DC|nr:hypothetical protein [Lysobacter sp. 5GHs7-4]UHQ21936.1 hypothetical protein LVB77_14805 [Lysobacter sp. 5GHs7-4]
MKLIKFEGHNVVFAENQPEYLPLPALRLNSQEGEIICCWHLTWRERLRLLLTGRLWHSVLTFGQPLQPQLLQVDTPTDVINAITQKVK